MTDPATDRKVKLTLVAALAYFVMPFDIIPDILPIMGFTDDAAVITAARRPSRAAATATLVGLPPMDFANVSTSANPTPCSRA